MNGMIFAAGLGTRLQPLTNDRPKALVEVAGKPLLEYVIRKMIAADVQRIVVNVHHYAEQIEAFLCERHFFDWDIVISDEREKLLDTGGGLLKARELFSPGESVLIHNVDIFSDIDIPALLRFHRQNKGDATLVTLTGGKGRGLRFNREGMLKGWENKATGEQKPVDEEFWDSRNYAFCGVQVVSPEFLERMSGKGGFSIIDEYLSQARLHPILMYFYEGRFLDLGTPQAIAEAETMLIGSCNP